MKRQPRVYISGPITNNPDYTEQFQEAENRLTAKGYITVNPAKMGEGIKALPYGDILDIDCAALDKCDYIYFLPGWEQSKGANQERLHALLRNIQILEDK